MALAPDVLLTTGERRAHTYAAGHPHRADRVHDRADPVGAGFVDSLARPGGNATGFVQFEFGLTSKWLELLKEISPGITRVAVLREPGLTAAVPRLDAAGPFRWERSGNIHRSA